MATIHVAQIQRLRCYEEPNGSLGVDHTGTIADFFDVPAIEGTVECKLEQPMIESKYLRQNRDDHAVEILGVKKAQLVFSIPFFLPTLRSAAGGSPVAIVDSPATKLLATWMGGHTLGTSMDANAGCTVSALATSDFANAAEGCGVAWADTAGVMYAREAVTVATDLVTIDQALPSAPVAADYLYRSIDLYLANRVTANVKSYQFLVEGADTNHDCWLLRGGQCITAPTFEFKPGERPTIKFTIDFATWDNKHELVTGIHNVTYTNIGEQMVSDGRFTAFAINVAAPDTPVALQSCIPASEISFDFANSKYVAVTGPCGTNTIAAYVMSGESPKIRGKFRVPLEEGDTTWSALRDAKTSISINFQIGSSESTGCILICIGCAQVTNWEITRANGIVEQEISWAAKLDPMHTTGVDTATELANSPVKIHVF